MWHRQQKVVIIGLHLLVIADFKYVLFFCDIIVGHRLWFCQTSKRPDMDVMWYS